jgi:hypothetical protein
MTNIADDSASIAQRLKELEADRKEAMTGSSAPVTGQEPKSETPYGYGGMDYCALGSLAHPGWPYAGTSYEWRVRL